MQCHLYKIFITSLQVQYAVITIANTPPSNRSGRLATSFNRECGESWRNKIATWQTRLCHYIDCNGINNHLCLQKLMLQKLCFIGIPVRQADIVFQRAYAAAAMHVMCPLRMVRVGAGAPAFIRQTAWHRCTANHRSSLAHSASCLWWRDGTKKESKPTAWSQWERNNKIWKRISYLFFFFGTTISGCIGNQCMINARTLVKLLHPAAFKSIHK